MIRVHLGFRDLDHRAAVTARLRELEPWDVGAMRDEPGKGVIFDLLGHDPRLGRAAVAGRVAIATQELPCDRRNVSLHAVRIAAA